MAAVRQNKEIATPVPAAHATPAQHAVAAIVHHGEHILSEIPRMLRRFTTLLLVLAISIPVFFAGLLFVLWHLAR
jgi:hypothetical protein